jgi:hypothetical protein
MALKIRQILLSGLVILLYSLLLNSCQAFEQPPAGVLQPQELILTTAAETIVADLAPLDTPAVPVETNTAFPNNPNMITSTSEPSPTLTHTPRPTPEWQLDFEDNFEEAGYWESVTEGVSRSSYIQEGYLLENYGTEIILSSTIWLDYGDVRVETNAVQLAGPESAFFGVVCRWQDEDNFYAFLISKTGASSIVKVQNGETSFLEEGSLEMEVLPSGRPLRVAGSCLGYRLILELEGEVLIETQDETFPVGLVGLAVGTGAEAGAEVAFENFKAYTPIPELAPFLTQTPTASLTTTPTPLETIIPSPTISPPTPAETALPSPTTIPPVVTPLPNLVYEDDFSIRAGWVIEEKDEFSMYYQAGGYRMHNRSSSSNISSTRSFEHHDIRVEVDAIRVRWSIGGYYGVVCRWQNFQNMYAFIIGGDGFHAIAKIQQGEVTFLQEGQTENGPVNSEGELNRINGICQGSQLALEVNGQRLLQTQDFTFGTGYVGLLVGNQDPPGNLVHFDNFTLYAPK